MKFSEAQASWLAHRALDAIRESGLKLANDRLALAQVKKTLARRLDRLGIGELVVPAAGSEPATGAGLVVRWRAFEQRRDLPMSGRVRGQMADIMAVISAHLPDGEAFDVEMRKPVVTVLRGVPAPVDDAKGALLAYRERLRADPEDEGVLLATYALACAAGERAAAERAAAEREAAAARAAERAAAERAARERQEAEERAAAERAAAKRAEEQRIQAEKDAIEAARLAREAEFDAARSLLRRAGSMTDDKRKKTIRALRLTRRTWAAADLCQCAMSRARA